MSTSTILIVEDEPIVALSIKKLLQDAGYKVLPFAVSGEEAIDKVRTLSPDLVLMDIKLEGEIDGIEAASSIRHDHEVPVIFLTANSDNELLERAKNTNAFGYLIKPFADKELISTIEIVLSKHRYERDLKASRDWHISLLKSMGDAVIAINTDGLVTFLNHAAQALTGWLDEDAKGKPLHYVMTIFDSKTFEPVHIPIDSIIHDETITRIENTFLLNISGKRISIANSAAPIWIKNKAVGVIVVFHEMEEKTSDRRTERKSADMTATSIQQMIDSKSILPICASCKAIRTLDGQWIQVEQFIRDWTQLILTHTFCDDCALKFYPSIFDKN